MNEALRTIVRVQAHGSDRVLVLWSDGTEADLDLSDLARREQFLPLSDPAFFARASVGEFGHSIAWSDEVELGADALWRMTLLSQGKTDTVAFLDWRMRHGLSLTAAAAALGLSRRMVAYYSAGERRVPWTVLLACEGWEARQAKLRPRGTRRRAA